MDKQSLIREILRHANAHPDEGGSIVAPLQRFGRVWWAGGQWWFSEQAAEISTYTATGTSSNFFSDDEFRVTKPLDDIHIEWVKQESKDLKGGARG